MGQSLLSAVAAGVVLLPFVAAQQDFPLEGTWSTKSHSVFTGPDFYDPVNEKIFEPSLPGISYSFTSNGHFEEAYYRAVANPQTPSCPEGIVQWQHGTFQQLSNGSLLLTPFGVDGRQMQSNPCVSSASIYTHYEQPELITRYSTYTDLYHNVPRLDLYQFNGAPMAPMYLAYSPPQMLPTMTLNPTAKPTSTGITSTTNAAKAKRNLEDLHGFREPMNKNVILPKKEQWVSDRIWWYGLGFIGIGSIGYFCF